MPENTLAVARPSKWGNRYRLNMRCQHPLTREMITVSSRAQAVELFRLDWEFHLARDPDLFRDVFAPLRGKNLACWCPLDQPCHVDVLIELANR